MGAMKIFREKGTKESTGHVLGHITVKNLFKFFGLLLIVIPLSFYLGWSIAYDTWTDVGLYSFVAPTVVFGILIIMLADEKYKEKSA